MSNPWSHTRLPPISRPRCLMEPHQARIAGTEHRHQWTVFRYHDVCLCDSNHEEHPMRLRFPGSRRSRSTRRVSLSLERMEDRTLLSAPEPNNTFDQAYTPPDNIYLEQNWVNSDSGDSSSDGDDFFKFYNLYGPSHLYAALDAQTADGDLYVYDQNKNLLAFSILGGNSSETINVDLPGNQYFYVRVHASSGSDNYSLFLYNDYAGSTMGTARDIGTSRGQGSDKFWAYDKIFSNDYLDYRDNVDFWKFKMEAPGTISLRMKAPTGSALGASMQLMDSSGNVLTNASGAAGDGLNLDRYTLNTGTYYVKLAQSTGSDPYFFR